MSGPLPTGFDPSKMMEYLASLPEDQQTELLQSAMGKVGEFQEKAQQVTTREGLIKRFKEARAHFVCPGGAFAEELSAGQINLDGVQFNLSNTNAKPNLDMRSINSLKPMIGKELVVGTTHRGRYLCGWVAIDDAFFAIASSSLLLEDVTGQLVEIAAYGLVDPDLPPPERQHALASRFSKGQPIVVFEPYFKVRQDMSEGIRVEQAKEMIPWREVPKNLESWKKLGNEYFGVLTTKNEGRGALACYERAIQVLKDDVGKIAVLLNNIATCRFKMGDYKAAIQLAGASVHLDPTYVKGWFRLASVLAENAEMQEEKVKQDDRAVAERVVAHACSTIPRLTTKERRLLEGTLKKEPSTSPTNYSRFRSYVEWCAKLESPGFLLVTKEIAGEAASAESKDADAWRKAGAEYFTKDDFQAADECYRKGIAARASCCRDIAPVLNNIAAVHLMLHQETSDVPNISVGGSSGTSSRKEDLVPTTEAALLSCTIAGVIDPLNYKAWTRRARCMQKLGYSQEECVADLNAIRGSVISKAFSCAESRERVQAFKQNMSADVDRRSQQPPETQSAQIVSNVPTDVQRKQRDALQSDKIAVTLLNKTSNEADPPSATPSGEQKESIDEYIARMESFEQMMRFGFATAKSKSSRQERDLPREIMMFVKHPPPQIHTEFPKLRGWPEGLDTTFAQKVLHRAYLDASASPWLMALSMRNDMFYKNMDPGDLIKRWHGTPALQMLQAKGSSLRLGDIIDGRTGLSDAIPQYDARIRSNFANNPNRAEVYFFGTTHVAIGFNDFSSLLAAQIQAKSSDTRGPLRFVGFEMSEFAVAKSKVVAQMLSSSSISFSSIMEVWLSSTWSETTLEDFRKSVKVVLKSVQAGTENPKVVSYLKHWVSSEPISASKARSEFFLNMKRYYEKSLIAPFCFRREIDRLDLTQYMLTGEVRASPNVVNKLEKELVGANISRHPTRETTATNKNRKKKKGKQVVTGTTLSVGSLTMWNVPAGAPPLEEDIAFNTVEFMTIVEAFVERQNKQKNSVDRLSVADLFMIHIIQNLHRLRGILLTDKLTIEVMYGVIKAVRGRAASDSDNLKLLTRIANMRPYTISWSNVLDYFLPEDFHDLARRCSVHGDCMHYGYSMNWPTQVYGASILDYNPEDYKELINTTLDTALGFTVAGSSMPSSMEMFKMMGLDKLVVLPLREHPLISTSYVLAHVFKKYWIDHFIKTGKLTTKASRKLGALCTPLNSGMQMGTMDLSMPSPLYRTSLTLYMSWCYDPELRLQGANNPMKLGAATDRGMLEDFMKHLSMEERQAFWKDMGAASSK